MIANYMQEQRKKIGVELRPSLHQRLYADAVGRGMKLWEAMDAAVEQYLGDKPEPECGPVVPRKYRDYPKKLAEVLASGDQMAIQAVVANIDFFRDRLRPAGEKRH